MKIKTIFFLLILMCSSSFAQWSIKKTEAKNEPSLLKRGDFALEITLHNESSKTLYVQGLQPAWYMVEAYIKNPKGAVWEKESIGVDRKLEMLPVEAGGDIKLLRSVSLKHAGHAMILTFLMAQSEHDHHGSQILVGEFLIPNPPKSEQSTSANDSSGSPSP
jgi:hypothetical protein